jgi:hypothetical protein
MILTESDEKLANALVQALRMEIAMTFARVQAQVEATERRLLIVIVVAAVVVFLGLHIWPP